MSSSARVIAGGGSVASICGSMSGCCSMSSCCVAGVAYSLILGISIGAGIALVSGDI